MWFVILKLLRVGVKEAKKHKAKKNSPDDAGIDLSNTRTIPDSKPERRPHSPKSLLETFLRFLQLVFALAVIGLYGQDLHSGNHPSAWVYALVTGFLGASTAMIYLILSFVTRTRVPSQQGPGLLLARFVWEAVLCILWLTLFGLFGKMYIGNYTPGSKTERMRHAVWVDLVDLGLWVGTMVWAGLRWWKGKKGEGEEMRGEDVEKAGP